MIYFLLAFQQLLASTTHIVGQSVGEQVEPVTVLIFRASIASVALLLIIWSRRSKEIPIERADWWKIALLGLLNVPINQWLFLEGLQHTTPANSALLYSMTPAMVFVMTLIAHREAPSMWKIVGIVLAFVGVSLIIFERGVTLTSEHTLGNLMIFLAVVAWSLYTLIGKPLVDKYSAIKMTGYNMALGSVMFLPIGLFQADLATVGSIAFIPWMQILYMALIASVLNYFLWFYALGKLQTSKVAIFQNLQPVMTTILALMLGKAVLTGIFVGGGILALIGVILVQLA